MYVGVLGINTDCLARSVMDCHGFGSAHCVVGWSCCVHLQGTRVTVCLCPNAECCLFPWLLLYRRCPADVERRKYFTLILCEIIPRKEYVFIFFSLYCQNICDTIFAGGVFCKPLHSVCAAAQLCGYLAFSLVFCSQELETQRFDSFLPCSISSMPWCACPPTGWCLQRSSVRADVLWELWLSPMSLISRCHCSPGLCFHPHSHPRQPSKPPGE